MSLPVENPCPTCIENHKLTEMEYDSVKEVWVCPVCGAERDLKNYYANS